MTYIDDNSNIYKEPFSLRLLHFIEDIWPTFYKIFNALFFGTIHFIIDTLSGLWRRY